MVQRLGLDEFFRSVASEIVNDARSKLIDEAWFGRPASGDIPIQGDRPTARELHGGNAANHSPLGWELPRESTGALGGRQLSFEELWAPRENAPGDAEKAPDHSPSHDLDR